MSWLCCLHKGATNIVLFYVNMLDGVPNTDTGSTGRTRRTMQCITTCGRIWYFILYYTIPPRKRQWHHFCYTKQTVPLPYCLNTLRGDICWFCGYRLSVKIFKFEIVMPPLYQNYIFSNIAILNLKTFTLEIFRLYINNVNNTKQFPQRCHKHVTVLYCTKQLVIVIHWYKADFLYLSKQVMLID